MQTIEFKTPTLNKKGEIVHWTDHTARQATVELSNGVYLDLLLIPGEPTKWGLHIFPGKAIKGRSTL